MAPAHNHGQAEASFARQVRHYPPKPRLALILRQAHEGFAAMKGAIEPERQFVLVPIVPFPDKLQLPKPHVARRFGDEPAAVPVGCFAYIDRCRAADTDIR